jgi:hypothetical protein
MPARPKNERPRAVIWPPKSLKLELGSVTPRPDHLDPAGLKLFGDDGSLQPAFQLQKSLHALDDRAPGSTGNNKDVETPLPDIVTVDDGIAVLRERLNKRLLNVPEVVISIAFQNRELDDQLIANLTSSGSTRGR